MSKKLGFYAFLFFACCLIDRISKLWALNYLIARTESSLIPGLEYTLSFNRGISWGLLNFEQPCYFFLVSATVITVVLAFLGLTVQHYLAGETLVGEMLVLSGALSNIIDRFVYGGVIDFIHIFWPIDWPIFNMADCFIVIGIGIIFYKQWRTL